MHGCTLQHASASLPAPVLPFVCQQRTETNETVKLKKSMVHTSLRTGLGNTSVNLSCMLQSLQVKAEGH